MHQATCYTESMEGYLTTQEAADILEVSRSRVIALIRAGRLPAEKFGSQWAIKEEDLDLVKDRKPGPAGWQGPSRKQRQEE